MSETTEKINKNVSKEQIKETIIELEEYRERLVSDIVQLGKKIKLSKKTVDKNIIEHPEIDYIDKILGQLRSEQI